MHADTAAHLKRRHDGVIPPTWLGGPPEFHEAKVLAAVAWHMVKDDTDPELPAADLAHQEKCIGVAESIIRGNYPDNSPFAQKAAQLWAESKTQGELTNA